MHYSEKEDKKLMPATTDTRNTLLVGQQQKDLPHITDAAVKEDEERTTISITRTTAATGFLSILVLLVLAVSTISYDNKPTNTHKYLEEQNSRILALEQEPTRTTPTLPEEHHQVDDEKDAAAIGILADVCTGTTAVSIICNLLVLFLASRKKENNEESQQPTYQRIMCALAINAIIIDTNFFIAGATGSMFKMMMLTLMTKASEESISFGCYMQAFVDFYFYFANSFCCVWLYLYFLLKLNHGIARISKCAELSAYLIIFLLTLAYVSFMYVNGTVSPNPTYGICSIFPDIYVMLIPMLLGAIFLLGIFSMLLIIYKTFRDEQEIDQLTSIQQQDTVQSSSLGSFEATKDIAMQAFALVLFLFFAFFLQIFTLNQDGFVYEIITVITYLSQGLYLLTLYLWFEMRNVHKKYPNMSKIDTFLSIFKQDVDVEHRYNQKAQLSTEQTPLMVDRKRCFVDMTLVEDDMCEDILRDLDKIDRKVGEEKDEEDEEMARQREAKRKEEKRIQDLQAENLRMNGGAYVSIDDMEDLQKAKCASFDDMKQELADRKHKHYNSLRDSNVPVRLRYGSIDPSTFRIDSAEEEIDNLSAGGTREKPTKRMGEVNLAPIQEEDKKKEKQVSVSSQDLSGCEEEDNAEDEEDNVIPPSQQPHSGYTIISDLTSISTLRF